MTTTGAMRSRCPFLIDTACATFGAKASSASCEDRKACGMSLTNQTASSASPATTRTRRSVLQWTSPAQRLPRDDEGGEGGFVLVIFGDQTNQYLRIARFRKDINLWEDPEHFRV